MSSNVSNYTTRYRPYSTWQDLLDQQTGPEQVVNPDTFENTQYNNFGRENNPMPLSAKLILAYLGGEGLIALAGAGAGAGAGGAAGASGSSAAPIVGSGLGIGAPTTGLGLTAGAGATTTGATVGGGLALGGASSAAVPAAVVGGHVAAGTAGGLGIGATGAASLGVSALGNFISAHSQVQQSSKDRQSLMYQLLAKYLQDRDTNAQNATQLDPYAQVKSRNAANVRNSFANGLDSNGRFTGTFDTSALSPQSLDAALANFNKKTNPDPNVILQYLNQVGVK